MTKIHKTESMAKGFADRIEEEIEFFKEKIVLSFENGDDFSPQRVTSLLLFLVEQTLSNPKGAQLDSKELNTLYQLRYLMDDFESLSSLEKVAARIKSKNVID
jgi:hypothetical protein